MRTVTVFFDPEYVDRHINSLQLTTPHTGTESP
jgi:hypothetical protein